MLRVLLLIAFAVVRAGASDLPPAFDEQCPEALVASFATTLAGPWNDAQRAATSAAEFQRRIDALPSVPRYGVTALTTVTVEPELDRENRFANLPTGNKPLIRFHPDTIRRLLREAEADGAVIGGRALRRLEPRGFEPPVAGRETTSVVFHRHRRASIVASFRDLAAPSRWVSGFNGVLAFFADPTSAREIDPGLAWFLRTYPFNEDNGYGEFVLLENFLLAANGALPQSEVAYLHRTRQLFVEALRRGHLSRYYANWISAELRSEFERRHFGEGAMPALLENLATAVERDAEPESEVLAPREAGRYLRFFARDRVLGRRDMTQLPELPPVGTFGVSEPQSLLLRKAVVLRNDPARIRLAQTLAWAFCALDKIVARHSAAQFRTMAQKRLERFFTVP